MTIQAAQEITQAPKDFRALIPCQKNCFWYYS